MPTSELIVKMSGQGVSQATASFDQFFKKFDQGARYLDQFDRKFSKLQGSLNGFSRISGNVGNLANRLGLERLGSSVGLGADVAESVLALRGAMIGMSGPMIGLTTLAVGASVAFSKWSEEAERTAASLKLVTQQTTALERAGLLDPQRAAALRQKSEAAANVVNPFRGADTFKGALRLATDLMGMLSGVTSLRRVTEIPFHLKEGQAAEAESKRLFDRGLGKERQARTEQEQQMLSLRLENEQILYQHGETTLEDYYDKQEALVDESFGSQRKLANDLRNSMDAAHADEKKALGNEIELIDERWRNTRERIKYERQAAVEKRSNEAKDKAEDARKEAERIAREAKVKADQDALEAERVRQLDRRTRLQQAYLAIDAAQNPEAREQAILNAEAEIGQQLRENAVLRKQGNLTLEEQLKLTQEDQALMQDILALEQDRNREREAAKQRSVMTQSQEGLRAFAQTQAYEQSTGQSQFGMGAVAGLKNSLVSLGTTASQVANAVQSVVSTAVDGISNAIEGLIMRTVTLKQALIQLGQALLQGLVKAFAQLAAQMLVSFILQKIFGAAIKKEAQSVANAWAPAAIAASIATEGVAAGVGFGAFAAAMISGTALASGLSSGYQQGGYTGSGSPGQVAGVVHRSEYVFPADVTARLTPSYLDQVVGSVRNAPGQSGMSGGGKTAIVLTDSRSAAINALRSEAGQATIINAVRRKRHEFQRA